MNLETIVIGQLETNCYILSKDGKCLIIDPGDNVNFIISKIDELEVKPVGIIITHNHEDHIGAVKDLIEVYEINSYDYNTLFEQKHFLDPFKFQVIYTPGHSEDSITIYFYDYGIMFTGDFLFKNTVGRTDLSGGSFKDMLNSIVKIKEYNDDIKIYPGHGLSTTLGYEKEHNKYFTDN